MNYTSIEQSKKLLELGLSRESADMTYPWYIEEDGDRFEDGHQITTPKIGKTNWRGYIPCWSVGALLGLMPKCIVVDGDNYFQYIAMGDTVSYCNVKDEKLVLFNYDFLLDSLFAMVVWLIENNYIKN